MQNALVLYECISEDGGTADQVLLEVDLYKFLALLDRTLQRFIICVQVIVIWLELFRSMRVIRRITSK